MLSRSALESQVAPRSAAAELFAGAAEPAARLFETDERGRATTVDTDFEALHSLYWLVVNLAHEPVESERERKAMAGAAAS
jgi:hypothetical protein